MAEPPAVSDGSSRKESEGTALEEDGPRQGRGLRREVGGRLMGAGAWTLVAVLLLVAGLVFVAGRTVTLQWAARQAVELSNGRLQIDGISGSVLSEIAADSVRWHDGGLIVSITAPRVTYQPFALLDGLVRIERISASEVAVTLPSHSPAAEPRAPIRLPAAMAALLPVAVERVDAARVVIRRGERELTALHNLEAVVRHDGDRINAQLLNLDVFLDGARVGMRGEAAVLARAPYATDGRLTVQVPLQPQALRLDVRLNGPVGELAVRATTSFAGAPLEGRTVVHSLDSRPLRQVRVEVKDFDLARYDRNLPSTRLSGTYEAEVMPAWASERRPLLIGPLELVNGAAGPLDRKRVPLTAAKAVVGWVGGRLEVQTLQASGPVGEISGDGWIGDGSFRLALSSERLQLRAINSTLKPRFVAARLAVEPIAAAAGNDRATPGGRVAQDGAAPGRRFDGRRPGNSGLSFDVEARDPTLNAGMKAVLSHGRLRISQAQVQLRAAAKGGAASATGMASFRGEIGVTGSWPVDLAGTFRDFEPAQLAAMSPALLNGKWRVVGRARGNGGVGGLLTTEMTLADSRLRNLPLAGDIAADITLKDGQPHRLSAVAAKLRWGSGTVQASGALGEEADALRIAFDLPKIGELRRWLDGAVRGEGILRGPLASPVAEGDIEGKGLVASAGALRASMSGAMLQLRTPQAGQMKMQARFDKVEVRARSREPNPAGPPDGPFRFKQITAAADGSFARHSLRVEAAGADQQLVVAASGGLDDDGLWHGSIERLEASGPAWQLQPGIPAGAAGAAGVAGGPVDLQSLRPFTVTVGDGYLNAREARLLMQGALLNLRDLDWQDPMLTVRGDAAGIPASWLGRFIPAGLLPQAVAAGFAAGGSDAAAHVTADAAVGSAASSRVRQDLRLAAAVDFRGSLTDDGAADWRGVLRLRRETGDLAVAPLDGGTPLQAGLKTLEASLSIGSQVIKLVANVEGDPIGRLSAEAQAPLRAVKSQAWSRAALADSPLSGRIQLATRSVRWLRPLAGGDWLVDGALSARLQLGGTVAQPRADGFVSGNDLSARDPVLGLHFTNGVLAAELAGGGVDVRLLRFSSGEGSVAISGIAQEPGDRRSAARIIVDRLALPLGTAERVVLSGSTTATLQNDSLVIAGRLVADEGDFDLDRRTARDEPAAARRPGSDRDKLAVAADVEVDLGRLFRISGSGIDAGLGGAIRVQGGLPRDLRATGTVELLHGDFHAVGRRLRIKHGRLLFDGPLANPTVDIVAIREHLKVEPGIAVHGPAQAPVVELVSEPEVDEAEKLSWLVHGRGAAGERGAADLAALQTAVAGTQATIAAAVGRLSGRLAGLYGQSLEAIHTILGLKREIAGGLSPAAQALEPAAALQASLMAD